MVKFILVVITIVFVGLAYYVNIGKDDSNVKPVVKTKESTLLVEQPLKVEVKKDVSKDAAIEKKVVKDSTMKKPTLPIEKKVVKSNGETNEDLTLESIENADVSDEERERMTDTLANTNNLESQDEDEVSMELEDVIKTIERNSEQN